MLASGASPWRYVVCLRQRLGLYADTSKILQPGEASASKRGHPPTVAGLGGEGLRNAFGEFSF